MRRMNARLSKLLDEMMDKTIIRIDRELSHELLIKVDYALIGRISDLTISISEVIQNSLIEDYQLTTEK